MSLDEITSGTWKEQSKRVEADLRIWHDKPCIKAIYIGKTSAARNTVDAAYDAMEARAHDHILNNFMEITHMKLLYITSSPDRINEAEKKMIAYNKELSQKCLSIRDGAGGNTSTQSHHVLYAALANNKKIIDDAL